MTDNKYKSKDVNFIGTITDSSETIINHNGRILQDALDRIEQLEKENEVMKKILVMFISNIRPDGDISYFSQESKRIIEDLLGQLIL